MSSNRTGYRGYISSRPFLGERAPQQIQNLVIRDYARRNGLEFKLSVAEYTMKNCFIVLNGVFKELPSLDGVILYSLFQLPQNAVEREEIYRQILESKCELHAAVEGLMIKNDSDARRIEDIWRVRQILPRCPQAGDLAAYVS